MVSMKRAVGKSHCPINHSLEIVGDPWSLLILRDIVCYNKRTFGDFMESKEKISSRMLTMRLASLQESGILRISTDPTDKRKPVYDLTEKGVALIPVLIELASWGSTFDHATSAPEGWKDSVEADRKLRNNPHTNRRKAFVANPARLMQTITSN
jgi:DNA-binding HxlR family transcriptional regulator